MLLLPRSKQSCNQAVQELTSYKIDTHCIVINQLLFPEHASACQQCTVRSRMQRRYLEEAQDLYAEDFNIVEVPLLTTEVRGVDRIKTFSEMLVKPFAPGGALAWGGKA